ncbi:Pirin-related protein [Hahella chejuensis KCTC 2396]|uniref:Pirin-related protein n=1 Tax=Hahella chejuensis (strain KCTC 2396) TaxID=349521 RepID=Q2SMQ6_HAHCH|nr:pirin family protein [Hahella chejuensis]ABC28068.1 Pirin-related protein [Hahella chejuensis KCTC 2396]
MNIRRGHERGVANFGWLHSKHTFSFGHYFDPAHMGFGPLRVINQDQVTPGAGFDTHGHSDMEIISYVVSGALEHKDSIGNGSVIVPGELQRMTAGTGIRHSEYNHSRTEGVEFLQIWIHPEQKRLKPGYEQKAFAPESMTGVFRLIGSRNGAQDSVTIHQDVNLYAARLDGAEPVCLDIDPQRGAWVQVVKGSVELNGEALTEGDGAALENVNKLTFANADNAEVLVFDMKMQA